VHTNNNPGLFSAELRDLLNSLFRLHGADRPSADQCLNHEWFNGETATAEEVRLEFQARFEDIVAQNNPVNPD